MKNELIIEVDNKDGKNALEKYDNTKSTERLALLESVSRDQLQSQNHHKCNDSVDKDYNNAVNHDTNGTSHSGYCSNQVMMSPVVLSILITEAAERFAYYGFRAILVLYFKNELRYDDSRAISLFAYTSSAAYFTPLMGAILADGYYGRYRTILYFSSLYLVGLFVLAYSGFLCANNGNENIGKSNSESNDCNNLLWWKRCVTLVGIVCSCIGTGGIKPCVSAFGADQIRKTRKIRISPTSNNEEECPTPSSLSSRDNNEERSRKSKNDCADTDNNSRSVDDLRHRQINTSLTIAAQNSHAGKKSINQGIIDSNDEENDEAIRTYFSFFYFCISVGAATSFTCIPIIRTHYGYGYSFLLVAIAMTLSILTFLSQREKYICHTPSMKPGESSLMITCQVCVWLLKTKLYDAFPVFFSSAYSCCSPPPLAPPVPNLLSSSFQRKKGREKFPIIDDDSSDNRYNGNEENSDRNDKVDRSEVYSSSIANQQRNELYHQQKMLYINDAEQVMNLMPIMAMYPLFWMLYDQQSSVWTLQAERMDLHSIAPEQIGVINPVEIMIFVPLFSNYVYPYLEHTLHCDVSQLRRMGYGMLLCSLSFVVSGVLDYIIEYHNDPKNGLEKVHVMWQLIQITLLSISEILMSITGLEFVYANSPKRMKTLLMSIYLLTTAIGDLLGGILYSSVFSCTSIATALFSCAIVMLLNFFLFRQVVQWWEQKQRHQQ